MATPLAPDELWAVVEPLLPAEPPKPKGGRPRVPDRACLAGIIFVLRSGIPWEMLPQELGCGSGMTCWRRVCDWHHAGVWEKLQYELLNRLRDVDQLDWSRAAVDASTVPAKKGAPAQLQERADHHLRSLHPALRVGWGSDPQRDAVSGAHGGHLRPAGIGHGSGFGSPHRPALLRASPTRTGRRSTAR